MPTGFDAKEIELIIQEFDHKIEDMHRKVRRHLLDKQKYPRPSYETLIAKIMDYKIPEFGNKVLEVLLDNVKYKANHRATIWKRWFDEDAKASTPQPEEKRDEYSMIRYLKNLKKDR